MWIKRKGAELLAEFSTLTKTLVKSGASKEDLEQAFKIGTGEIDLAAIKNKLSKEPEDNGRASKDRDFPPR